MDTSGLTAIVVGALVLITLSITGKGCNDSDNNARIHTRVEAINKGCTIVEGSDNHAVILCGDKK